MSGIKWCGGLRARDRCLDGVMRSEMHFYNVLCGKWVGTWRVNAMRPVRRPLQLSKGVVMVTGLVVFRGGAYSVDFGGGMRLAWIEEMSSEKYRNDPIKS